MKKLVPNPDYQTARYRIAFWFGKAGIPHFKSQAPEIRTNNPNFLTDHKGEIPSHIVVDVPDEP